MRLAHVHVIVRWVRNYFRLCFHYVMSAKAFTSFSFFLLFSLFPSIFLIIIISIKAGGLREGTRAGSRRDGHCLRASSQNQWSTVRHERNGN